MPASGTSIFTDSDDYEASLKVLDLLVLQPREFQARLTWVQLPTLRLICAQETASRIAFVALPAKRVFVTFPTRRGFPLVCDGIEMRFGDIMFHSRGERLHQRTTAASCWGSISLAPTSLMALGRTLAGKELVSPPVGLILRAPSADRTQLLRLHAQACRLAERNMSLIGHPEVARALDQDLILALTTCLATGVPQDYPANTCRDSKIMARFEEVRTAHPHQLLRMIDICSAIGVSEQTLNVCCGKLLGMSPRRYLYLRQLNIVRAELLRSDTATVSLAELAKRHGFRHPRRFVAEYLKAFGEIPFRSSRSGDDGRLI